MNPIVTALAVMLGLSMISNVWLFRERDEGLRAEARAEQLNDDTRTAADACSLSVDTLATKGEERQKRLEAALGSLAPQIKRDQRASVAALAATAKDAADLCGSMLEFWKAEIKRDREANP